MVDNYKISGNQIFPKISFNKLQFLTKITVTSILDQHGLTYICRNQINEKEMNQITKPFLKVIKQRLDDMALQLINEETHTITSKLDFLRKIKNTFSPECYLKIKNCENRRAFTKLRSSSHDLLIETGRWCNIKRSTPCIRV